MNAYIRWLVLVVGVAASTLSFASGSYPALTTWCNMCLVTGGQAYGSNLNAACSASVTLGNAVLAPKYEVVTLPPPTGACAIYNSNGTFFSNPGWSQGTGAGCSPGTTLSGGVCLCPTGYAPNSSNNGCAPVNACSGGSTTRVAIGVTDTQGAACIATSLTSSTGICQSGYPTQVPSTPTVDGAGCPINTPSSVRCAATGVGGEVVCTYTATMTGQSPVISAQIAAVSAVASQSNMQTVEANGTVSVVSAVEVTAANAAASAAQAAGASSSVAAADGQAAAANAAAQAVVNAATGGGSGGSSAVSDGISQYCSLNPSAQICQNVTPSSFADACSVTPSPSCTGDAVQCVVAESTYAAACALAQQYVSDHTQSDLGTSAVAGTDSGNTNNPANSGNHTTTAISSLVNEGSNVWSHSGLQDETFNTNTNYSVTIPFSKLNGTLQTIGAVGVAITMLAALFIIFM